MKIKKLTWKYNRERAIARVVDKLNEVIDRLNEQEGKIK